MKMFNGLQLPDFESNNINYCHIFCTCRGYKMGRSGAQALSFYGTLELGPALDPLESLEEILDFLYTK